MLAKIAFRFALMLLAIALPALGLAKQSVATEKAAPAAIGEAHMIPITTPDGTYRVWVQRVGNNPKLKVLLLHGGPGMTHEYLEAFGKFLPQQGIEFYYYDQLGSGNSDRPKDDALWTTSRFVDEVEQVRKALSLGPDNFCLFGHSWGGILAMEYALRYQQNLKCLIISNMMASIPAYNAYARNVLMPEMDQQKLAEVKKLEASGETNDPRYMKLLMDIHYEKHVLRRPPADWPDAVNRSMEHMNPRIYTLMQGPSELGASGRLEHWDRFADLPKITVPTLVIGARYDTMDPVYMEKMAIEMPLGDFLYLPQGSHFSMWDDQQRYFEGLITFLRRQEK